MASTELVKEAERLMGICNACRYCEGHCAVFPAMEMRFTFPAEDLRYLANLCHGCGSCFHHCQYAPPHEFNVNVPRVFDALRRETYARHVWPSFLAPLFKRNGLATGLVTAVACIVSIRRPPVRADPGPGAFYAVVPHSVMVVLFGLAFAYALFAMAMACRRFWRESGEPGHRLSATVHNHATWDSASLRYLDGGGVGTTISPSTVFSSASPRRAWQRCSTGSGIPRRILGGVLRWCSVQRAVSGSRSARSGCSRSRHAATACLSHERAWTSRSS